MASQKYLLVLLWKVLCQTLVWHLSLASMLYFASSHQRGREVAEKIGSLCVEV